MYSKEFCYFLFLSLCLFINLFIYLFTYLYFAAMLCKRSVIVVWLVNSFKRQFPTLKDGYSVLAMVSPMVS